MMATDLVQQGIAALKAGDKAQAEQFFRQAIKDDKKNEQAWYYLGMMQTDPARRRQCLETVLKINPANAKAQKALTQLNAESPSAADAANPSAAPKSAPARKPKTDAASTAGTTAIQGFKLPVSIPDAPANATIAEVVNEFVEMIRSGINILMRKPGVYETEAERATWWRFWVLLIVGGLIGAVAAAVSSLFLQFRLASIPFLRYNPNFLAPILTLIFMLPISMAVAYAAFYASHWWAKNNGGQASLVQHSYVAAIPWVTTAILTNLITIVLTMLGLGLEWFLTLALNLYAIYIMVNGLQMIHQFTETNKKWITAAVMFIVSFVVSLVLTGVLGALITPRFF